MEPPKISNTKSISIKQEPKTSSTLPSGNNNGKVLTTEKVKKEAEKRPADKVSFYFNLVYDKVNQLFHRQKETMFYIFFLHIMVDIVHNYSVNLF